MSSHLYKTGGDEVVREKGGCTLLLCLVNDFKVNKQRLLVTSQRTGETKRSPDRHWFITALSVIIFNAFPCLLTDSRDVCLSSNHEAAPHTQKVTV